MPNFIILYSTIEPVAVKALLSLKEKGVTVSIFERSPYLKKVGYFYIDKD